MGHFLIIIWAFIGSVFGMNHTSIPPHSVTVHINPSPTQLPTNTPSPLIMRHPQQFQTQSKIDCIGPDGKHLSISQQQCDAFNNAWKQPSPQGVTQTGDLQQGGNGNLFTVNCTTDYGTVPQYGTTMQEAQNRCAALNAPAGQNSTSYPVIAPSSNTSVQLAACINSSEQSYQDALKQGEAKLAGGQEGGSSSDIMLQQQLQQSLNQAIAQCHAFYGN
jgi:hypothetical protein